MPPRGRKRKSGHLRKDAARDHMRDYGFEESVISESIKELLEVYGEDQWFFIEEASYDSLLSTCLKNQEKLDNQVAGNQEKAEALNEKMADEEQPNQLVGEEEKEEKEQEQDRHVEDGKDQADELLITNEAVTDPSPAAFHLGEASADYKPNSFEGNITVALNEEMAGEEQPNQLVGEEEEEEEQEQEQEQEQNMHIEGGRDQVDELSITNEAETDPSPAAFHLGDASADYALSSVEGVENRHCGWLSSEEEEETNPKEDSDGDDDEIIQLTPEPLCEELEELLREVRAQTKRKKETRWDK